MSLIVIPINKFYSFQIFLVPGINLLANLISSRIGEASSFNKCFAMHGLIAL